MVRLYFVRLTLQRSSAAPDLQCDDGLQTALGGTASQQCAELGLQYHSGPQPALQPPPVQEAPHHALREGRRDGRRQTTEGQRRRRKLTPWEYGRVIIRWDGNEGRLVPSWL